MRGWHKAAIAMLVVSLLLAVVFPFIPRPVRANPDPSWWDTDWGYRKKLTFDNSEQTENLLNFPFLVKLTPANFIYAYCEADGSDIRFIDADDSTSLDYHFEQWTYNGTSWIWVEVPQIDGSSSTDYIWLYYGNSAATDAQDEAGTYDDDGHYVGVWHLNDTDGATPTQHDSTSYNNDGIPVNTESGNFGVSGYINGVEDFDGTDDYVDITGVEGNISVTTGTFELSIKMASGMANDSQRHGILEIGATGNNDNLIAIEKSNLNRLQMGYKESGVDYNAQILDISGFADTWKYIAGVWDATNVYIYEDGVLKDTIDRTASPSINQSRLDQAILGADAVETPDAYYDGMIDEVRISNIARSADWISAYYLSTTNSFVTYSDIELTGWGWCPDEPRGIGNVSFPVIISAVPRTDAPESSDIRLTGSLELAYEDTTTRNFALNLTGIKARSLFHLRQNGLDTNGEAMGAAFNGPWLTWNSSGVEEHYIGGAGIIWLPHGNLSKTIKPYYFLLRTPAVNISVGTLGTGFVGNINNIIYSFTRGFDTVITALMDTEFRDTVSNVLDSTAVIVREVRDRIGPYIP